MTAKILRLNKAGTPNAWVDYESAAITLAKGQVVWSMGSLANTLHGGMQRSGERSFLDIPAIIAVDGHIREKSVPRITNKLLFQRDRNLCLYCDEEFRDCDLTRDHVIPSSRGGADEWQNCVASCRRCNHQKADRTPEEAGMRLVAVPYAPNLYEYFYLCNRNVLADQMEYLKTKFQNVVVS